jgi:hypothetical protein
MLSGITCLAASVPVTGLLTQLSDIDNLGIWVGGRCKQAGSPFRRRNRRFSCADKLVDLLRL